MSCQLMGDSRTRLRNCNSAPDTRTRYRSRTYEPSQHNHPGDYQAGLSWLRHQTRRDEQDRDEKTREVQSDCARDRLSFAANPAAYCRIFLRGTASSLNSEPVSRDLSAHRSARDRRVRRRGRVAYPVALNVRADDCRSAAHCRLMLRACRRPGCARPTGHGSAHGCKSAWWSRPGARATLDSPDVVVLLQKMCREGVAQRVGCAALGDAGLSDRRLHHSLQHGLVQVVPPALARLPMEVDARLGKDPLPRPLPARVRILPYERRRQLDPAGAVLQVILMLLADALEMPRQRPFHRHGSIVTR